MSVQRRVQRIRIKPGIGRLLLPAAVGLLLVGFLPAGLAAASVPTVAAGSGAAIGWGGNGYGQLGNDNRTERSGPVQANGLTSGVTAIRSGNFHTLALTSGGAVSAWGRGSNGELGDGTGADRATPVPVTGLSSGVKAVSAGGSHSLAVRADGSAVAWGYNGYGQLGYASPDGANQLAPVQVQGLTSGVVAVAGGQYHSLALRANGSVLAWGSDDFGELGDGRTDRRSTPAPVHGLSSGVIAIAAGDGDSFALESDGSVWAWGGNAYGELGDGTTTTRMTPVPVAGLTSGVVAIAAGRLHTLALKADGSVLAWGTNFHGEIGDGSTTTRYVPTPVSALSSGVQDIAAAEYHSLALRSDGSVVAWGLNDSGQLGDGTTTERHLPTAVQGLPSPVLAIAAGYANSVAISSSPLPLSPPAPRISIMDTSVVEGTSAGSKPTTVMSFKLTLDKKSTSPITVGGSTSDGTATTQTTGKDYTGKSQTITIPAGQLTGFFKVKVFPDSRPEPDESLTVTLYNPTNALIGVGSATGTIVNDD